MTMATSEMSTEILVHITAPSRASDDVRYRALASAYLAFEPARTITLPRGTIVTESPQRSGDAFISPQASFRSVWDNVNSPGLATRKGNSGSQSNKQSNGRSLPQDASHKGDETQVSWIAPLSEVPDSMPDNDISVAVFCTPTRVLNYYLQNTEPPSGSPATSSQRLPEGSRNAFHGTLLPEAYDTVVLSGEASTSLRQSKRGTTSIIGSVPAPAADVATGNTQANLLSRNDIDGTILIPSTQQWERAESEPPPSKRLKRGPAKEDAQALGRSVSDLLPTGSKQGPDLPQVSPEGDDEEIESFVVENPDWSHVTEIISAEPLVANHSLGPRPPVSLERLAEDMEMQRRYRPTYQAREMRPYERGYWLVSLDGWDHREKVAFWGFLGNWIRRDGNAGWGTRACRDELWAWTRLYGWEHIAGELYILLYVASYRLLKCMEMTFHDGAGNVLVVVGARSDRRRLG